MSEEKRRKNCPKCGKKMEMGVKTWICKDCTVLLREEFNNTGEK